MKNLKSDKKASETGPVSTECFGYKARRRPLLSKNSSKSGIRPFLTVLRGIRTFPVNLLEKANKTGFSGFTGWRCGHFLLTFAGSATALPPGPGFCQLLKSGRKREKYEK